MRSSSSRYNPSSPAVTSIRDHHNGIILRSDIDNLLDMRRFTFVSRAMLAKSCSTYSTAATLRRIRVRKLCYIFQRQGFRGVAPERPFAHFA
jgi:hypothetical protein